MPVLMRVLGIESSCDETGAAVVDAEGRVISDVVQSQVDLHARYGGVIPELASRDHLRNASVVVEEALVQANCTYRDLAGIAVTNRPGLVGGLLVGVQLAKGLAWGSGLPLVGVDHLVGHLLAVFLRRSDASPRPPTFPFVALLASGGHTALYRVDGPAAEAIRELGGTRDDAAGEAFDKVAKLLSLGYPGGPRIDALAKLGNPKAFPFRAPMSNDSSLEMSFSGLKTKVARFVEQNGVPETEAGLADVAASFQANATGVLAQKLLLAAEREGVQTVAIGGGVAANSELRRRVEEGARARGFVSVLPELKSSTDNAAMIAYAGACRLARGERDGWDLVATSKTALPRATRKGRGPRADE